MQSLSRPGSAAPVHSSGWDHLSYSAVSLFASCPLRFYFKYVLRLPERLIASSLVFGKAMHAAVQFHFEQLLAGCVAPDLDTLLEAFQDEWEAHADLRIKYAVGETRDTLGRLAERLLWAFQESDFSHPNGIVLGVEEELRGDIVPGCPELLARVDLLIDTGAELVLSDFKTSRSTWSHEKSDDAAPQLLLYHELVQPIADGKPVRLSFAVLPKVKSSSLLTYGVPADTQQIERTKRIVERVWHTIQGSHYYPNPSPMSCPSCPYRAECRAWTGENL